MKKPINFSDYSINPQTIVKIIAQCSKPIDITELSIYPKEDINKLIENNYIKNENNLCSLPDEGLKFNQIFTEYRELLTSLYPVIALKRNILQLNLAWCEFCNLIQSFSDQLSEEQQIIELTETDNIKLEHYTQNFFSVILKIRDLLKISFISPEVAVGHKKITPKLIDKYEKYVDEYKTLTKNTIDRPEVSGFSNFFRNRLEHGGDMTFYLLQQKQPGVSIQTVVCDYSLIEQSPSLTGDAKNNLYRYCNDRVIYYMQALSNGFPLTELTQFQKDEINFSLKLRKNDKDIDIGQLDKDNIKQLLNDKEFILSIYNFRKEYSPSNLGLYQFNMSECIGNVYDAHINLYEQLYQWVLICEKEQIEKLSALKHELKMFDVQGEDIIFELQMDKKLFRKIT